MFIRIKRGKNGQRYRYLEHRWREGERVRSRSQYLGKEVDPNSGWAVVEKMMKDYPVNTWEPNKAPPSGIEPIEKPPTTIDLSARPSSSELREQGGQSPSDAPASELSNEQAPQGETFAFE